MYGHPNYINHEGEYLFVITWISLSINIRANAFGGICQIWAHATVLTRWSGGMLVQQTTTPRNGLDGSNWSNSDASSMVDISW
jgi:hypothetical protein